MTITAKILIGLSLLIGVIALGVGFAAYGSHGGGLGSVGVGQTQTNTSWFVNGVYAGVNQQFAVDGAGTLTDTTGCLVLGNLQGTTSYLTVGTSTVSISTTKPASCK